MLKRIVVLLFFVQVSFTQDQKQFESFTYSDAQKFNYLNKNSSNILDRKSSNDYKDGDVIDISIATSEEDNLKFFFINKIIQRPKWGKNGQVMSFFTQDTSLVPNKFLVKTWFDFEIFKDANWNYDNSFPSQIFGLPSWMYDLDSKELRKTKYYYDRRNTITARSPYTVNRSIHPIRADFYYTKNNIKITLSKFYYSGGMNNVFFNNKDFRDEHLFKSSLFNYSFKSFPNQENILSKLPQKLYYSFSKEDFDFNKNYEIEFDLDRYYISAGLINNREKIERDKLLIKIGDIQNGTYLNIEIIKRPESSKKGDGLFTIEATTFYKKVIMSKERYTSPQFGPFNINAYDIPRIIKLIRESEKTYLALNEDIFLEINSLKFNNYEIEAYQAIDRFSDTFYSYLKKPLDALSLKSRYDDGQLNNQKELESAVSKFLNAAQLIDFRRITINQDINYNFNYEANPSEWNGSGSGFFVSNDGYLATNYHVIEGAKDIEVSYNNGTEILSYSAEIIQSDPTNDLAIIKINDSEFKKSLKIPYNLKTTSADVGSEVFALGYPMALSGMGEDIKFTDGKISSKTGFNGDIRLYQTTTPIQPGNSGGPLFDYDGNLIGVNSSKISSDIADNVSYSIKSSYLGNLIDVLPPTVSIPSSNELSGKSLTEIIKILSKYVVLIKVK